MTDNEIYIPVAAPIDSDSAGHGGRIAAQAVMRVICPSINSSGTGFLHHSGRIITAEHVVRGCQQTILVLPNSSQVPATVAATDADHDLALLQPQQAINATPLAISDLKSFSIGTQVSTWGFPGGYRGASPMPECRISRSQRRTYNNKRKHNRTMGSERCLQFRKLRRAIAANRNGRSDRCCVEQISTDLAGGSECFDCT